MAYENIDFWYDGQMRRYLEQLVEAFSGYQFMTGYGPNGSPPQLKTVPCRMATTNRLVANILRNQSEASLNTVPMITIFQNGLKFRTADLQNPNHVDTLQVVERLVDANGHYTSERGNSYSVQRLMPMPYEMNIQVDIWTSTQECKYQLMEQILTIIAPSFDIQNSENPLDWTAKSTCYLEDVIWSSRGVEMGTEDTIDIATINLRLPMWLSAPAKVKRQRRIEEIITNITDGEAIGQGSLLVHTITTPEDYCVSVDGSKIILLTGTATERTAEGLLPSWADCLKLYGRYQSAVTQIRLHMSDDINSPYIGGTIQLDANNVNELSWTIDPATLPANTLTHLTALIYPMQTFPGHGLPSVADGARYLIMSDISGPSVAWEMLTAKESDIIERVNGVWVVKTHALGNTNLDYVLNSASGSQIRWTGQEWVLTIGGRYGPGYWRLAF